MQIVVKNISKIFNKGMSTETKALANVSAKISNGEFIAIIGHTGSGKTTFIEHLNALSVAEEGEILISYKTKQKNKKTNKEEIITKERIIKKGHREIKFIKNEKGHRRLKFIKKGSRKIKKINEIRKQVGVVFQFAEYQLFEETILKDIMFGPLNMGSTKEEAKKLAQKYVKVVGLDESYLKRSPFDLSGGQKRRVALAGILAMEPQILIFDEPTAGLDPEGATEILEIFKDLNKKGKTIIIVTHDLDHVLEYSKRTIMFRNGKIVKDGDTYDILDDVQGLYDNELEPPKIIRVADTLRKKGLKLGRVTNIKELAQEIIRAKSKKMIKVKNKKVFIK